MFKLRIAILGAAAALALGTAGAMAMSEGIGGADPDGHGDAVASAARNCPHHASGDRDSHGDCVSAIASANGNNGDTDTGKGAGQSGKSTAPGQVCKANDSTEAAEPQGKAADKTEDKAEQQALAACVTAHAGATTGG